MDNVAKELGTFLLGMYVGALVFWLGEWIGLQRHKEESKDKE